MGRERRRLMATYHENVKYALIMQDEILRIESRLQVLSYPVELTMSDRLRYYDMLSEADVKSSALELSAEAIIDAIEDNSLLVLSDDVRQKLRDLVEENHASFVDTYGACAVPVELPLLDIITTDNREATP